MASDPEAGWAVTAMAPGVDGGDGDTEVVGEVLDAEEPVKGVHPGMVGEDPFIPMPATLSRTLSVTLQPSNVFGGRWWIPLIAEALGNPCSTWGPAGFGDRLTGCSTLVRKGSVV